MGKFISVISLMICLAFLGNGCDDEGTESMPYLTVAVDTVDFNNEEASRAVAVDANVEWHAEVAEDWVDVTGNGNSMTIHVLENTELASREARITVTGGALHDEVLVRQLGVEPAIMFSPESIEAEGEGGNDTVKIITNASWAVAAPDWVDAPQRLEATDTTFAFFVHSNMADSRRDSVIVFREETTGKTDTLRIMQHALHDAAAQRQRGAYRYGRGYPRHAYVPDDDALLPAALSGQGVENISKCERGGAREERKKGDCRQRQKHGRDYEPLPQYV